MHFSLHINRKKFFHFFQNLQVQVFHSEVVGEGKVQSLEGSLDCFECAKAWILLSESLSNLSSLIRTGRKPHSYQVDFYQFSLPPHPSTLFVCRLSTLVHFVPSAIRIAVNTAGRLNAAHDMDEFQIRDQSKVFLGDQDCQSKHDTSHKKRIVYYELLLGVWRDRFPLQNSLHTHCKGNPSRPNDYD